jgi:hypothetical protein
MTVESTMESMPDCTGGWVECLSSLVYSFFCEIPSNLALLLVSSQRAFCTSCLIHSRQNPYVPRAQSVTRFNETDAGIMSCAIGDRLDKGFL